MASPAAGGIADGARIRRLRRYACAVAVALSMLAAACRSTTSSSTGSTLNKTSDAVKAAQKRLEYWIKGRPELRPARDQLRGRLREAVGRGLTR